jgi:oligoendopeptidase F
MKPAPQWDMERIEPGGVASARWKQRADNTLARARPLVTRADDLPDLPDSLDAWESVLLELESLGLEVWEVSVIASCQSSSNTRDREASAADSRMREIAALTHRAWVRIEDGVAHCSEPNYEALATRPALSDVRPRLDRMRANANLLLPRDQQALVRELGPDTLDGWGALYQELSGRLEVPLNGETLSPGQAFNQTGAAEREVRLAAFSALASTWGSRRDTWASCLTHLTGLRQTLNDRRGVDPLADSLAAARMEPETLDAMDEAIRGFRPHLTEYLGVKARVLGLDGLHWVDVAAPVGEPGPPHDWETSSQFVLEHLHNAQPDLGDFTRKALEGRWIEAEDRPGKRGGGYCTWLPISKESRIFMTHGGRFRSTVTLAHELGHAYHNEVLKDVAPARRAIPMTLAESASTFAENVVRDAALAQANGPGQRLALLDARLRAGVTFLMNIPARFSFEKHLYALRREGVLNPDTLDEAMVAHQKEAYSDALTTWSPTFWCAKMHFYFGGRSFYNFPYAFGYLFSALVYEQLKDGSAASRAIYRELLVRTGHDRAEPLAMELLGLDLTDPATWRAGMEPLVQDLADYKEAAEAYNPS